MPYNKDQTAPVLPTTGNLEKSSINFLPRYFRTSANQKFLNATLDQMISQGEVDKVNAFVGRKTVESYSPADNYLDAITDQRNSYQLEPAVIITDELDNVEFYKDYIDYINQLSFFKGVTNNHSTVNSQEYYSWDPHINWDKIVNYREYYWLPYGPLSIPVAGQQDNIISTYTVVTVEDLDNVAYLFTPDGLTRNPNLTLYRGQTYKFEIDCPGNPIAFKTVRETGDSFFYTNGISTGNTYIEKGVIEFQVPFDAPNIIYYVNKNDIDASGFFKIYDITDASSIDVEKEIVGKKTYTMSNDIALSNGMKIFFQGRVTPEKYSNGAWYVDGVGTAIKLISENDLATPASYATNTDIEFDNEKFDTQGFDVSNDLPSIKDYIVINRSSTDKNPWSRYNRWFHREVIEQSFNLLGLPAILDQSARAIRPIIEFDADLQLWNFGRVAKQSVTLVDTFTKDVFSTIEGSTGYNIDGIPLIEGMRVLFTADTDLRVVGRIFKVKFVTHLGIRRITMIEEPDGEPVEDDTVLVMDGLSNKGTMFSFKQDRWTVSQQKTTVNQPPLFDVFDIDGYSYGDLGIYEGTTFIGTKLFSYSPGTAIDSELGFGINYRTIGNIGDIVFDFNLLKDTFIYKQLADVNTSLLDQGYLKKTVSQTSWQFVNGWQPAAEQSTQYIVSQFDGSDRKNFFPIDTVNNPVTVQDQLTIKVYVNGKKLNEITDFELSAQRNQLFVILVKDITNEDSLVIRVLTNVPKNNNGFYEIPANLETNPANDLLEDITLGEVINHVKTMADDRLDVLGNIPGPGNLRDLGDITKYGKKVVQHSSPLAPLIYHFTSKEHNIVNSLRFAREEYAKFKRNFTRTATTLGFDGETRIHFDLVMRELVKNKNNNGPFYFTDMAPYAGEFIFEQTVIDDSIIEYPLTFDFNLESASDQAVLVYLNEQQLIHGKEYEFVSNNFVRILTAISEGDELKIVQYESTDGCYIPSTPSKLGLYPLFEPKIFLDDSYQVPVAMIQGHDGSLVKTFGDFRDQLLLELELRIFNNCKVRYNTAVFDIDSFVSSFYRRTDLSLEDLNSTLRQDFLKWTRFVSTDFTKHDFYDTTNSFTYNYSNFTAIDDTAVPGFWRGVYRYYFDTDRPHTAPWEMLGYSMQPRWWESVYGPAPYTSDNLILWQDLSEGIVREPGKLLRRNSKYARPQLLDQIPVTPAGKLRSPIQSNSISNFVATSAESEFKFGDHSPVESAWRKSSEYPFALLTALTILRPAKIFAVCYDRIRQVRNPAGQLIYNTGASQRRFTTANIKFLTSINDSTRTITSGLANYVADYSVQQSQESYKKYKENLSNIDVTLAFRVGGFASKEKFRMVLDSRNPLNKGNVFVPSENYSIILNTSSPLLSIDYSGVIVEKQPSGFIIRGYNQITPEFKYFKPIKVSNDPVVNIGGISEAFVTWTPNNFYNQGQVIRFDNNGFFYRVVTSHTSNEIFEEKFFVRLSALPVTGGRNVIIRNNFSTEITSFAYGTEVGTIQDVVDFMLGYGRWLESQGFIFEFFSPELGTITNWLTSAKEFAFWTTQNWAAGAIISLSPGANELVFEKEVAVADNVFDNFYEYSILKQDGQPLDPLFISTIRKGQRFVVRPIDTADGVYHITLNLVQKEHVLLLDDKTVFNDVIFDKTQGYRQDRIKVLGYRTGGWQGDFNIPGFIYDRAEVTMWKSWTDYALGDTVKYKEFYYSAKINVPGTEIFEPDSWYRLPERPTSSLIPNWDYKANQFADFYDLDTDSFDVNQQKFAQHLIGYQRREYLENIINDDVAQYKFYQGMIRDKGTFNVLNKLFDPLSTTTQQSLEFFEEWAVRVGQYGAVDAFEEVEYRLDESKFLLNPQPVELVDFIGVRDNDFVYRITNSQTYLAPNNYSNKPFPLKEVEDYFVDTAGYVRPGEVDFVVNTTGDFVNFDISQVADGTTFWVGFEQASWNVYRFTQFTTKVTLYQEVSPAIVRVTLSNNVDTDIEVGDYIGINSSYNKTDGIYQVVGKSFNSVDLNIPDFDEDDALLASNSSNVLYKFISLRLKTSGDTIGTINGLNSIAIPRRIPGEVVWVDGENNQWSVWQYNNVYSSQTLIDPANFFGSAIAVNDNNTMLAVTAQDRVLYFNRPASNFPWSFRDVLLPGVTGIPTTNNSFGSQLAITRDAATIFVAAPLASNVTVPGTQQGYVAVYKKSPSDTYIFEQLITSEVPTTNEKFGTKLAVTDKFLIITTVDGFAVYDFEYEKIDTVTLGGIVSISASNNKLAVSTLDETVYIYQLTQDSVSQVEEITDAESSVSATFGSSVALSRNGLYLAVGIFDFNNQGAVSVYQDVDNSYEFSYKITPPTSESSIGYGEFVKFNINGDQLAVYAPNAEQVRSNTFDTNQTTFDSNATTFSETNAYIGNVFVYDRYDKTFIYADQLQLSGKLGVDYGSSLFVTDKFYVGDPIATDGGVYEYTANGRSWTNVRTAEKIVDLSMIKSVFLYDIDNNSIIDFVDVVDVLQGKILGIAEQELSFKTAYDPAVYNIGTQDLVIDGLASWTKDAVGKLWWDISATKFIEAHQGSIVFKNNSWNSTFAEQPVAVFEWVESRLTPDQWDELADTEEGLARGISGTSKYGNFAYSLEQIFDPVSETLSSIYYFWVRNKTTIPMPSERKLSAKDVAGYIVDPKSKGARYVALLGDNQFSLVNCKNVITGRNVAINFRYYTAQVQDKNIHSHYQLIAEGDVSRRLNTYIEKKWIDSLIGFDEFNNEVPDPRLPAKLKYGVLSKPRQSMFVNRIEAVKQFVERVNSVLEKNNIVDFVDISGLYVMDEPPTLSSLLFDEVRQRFSELRFVNSASFRPPQFSAVVENGRINRIIIINSGRGYTDPTFDPEISKTRKGPMLTVKGSGTGAKISTVINQSGEIISTRIENRGNGYLDDVSISARPLTVLITSDEQSNNKWALYEWNVDERTWTKELIQVFDTTKYWRFIDWYASGVNQFTKVNHRVDFSYQIASQDIKIGETVKVKNIGAAGWLLLQKISNTDNPLDINGGYKVIGRQQGTIQLNDNIYRFANSNIGFDGPFYDADVYDDEAKEEFRIIITELKDKIFINDLAEEFNKLFFVSLRYIFSEQLFVDWAFKTSFIKSKHNLGELKRKISFQSDNLENYEDFIREVKPYRSKIREFVSAYNKLDQTNSAVDDFDLPPIFNATTGTIEPLITTIVDGSVEVNNNIVLTEPYSSWFYNVGHSVKEISVRSSGSGYETAPLVQIVGTSRLAASATAFVSQGRLIKIIVTEAGEGYIGVPVVELVGGLRTGGTPAQLSIELERGPVRSNLIGVKFDRISSVYELSTTTVAQQFEGSGSRTRFDLKWPANLSPRTYTVEIDGVELLDSEFMLENIADNSNTYDRVSARITFQTAPSLNSIIVVKYTKNISLLSAADRINFMYEPGPGQLGKDLGQLMRGVDYGGVSLQGLNFSIGSGYDAVPWYTGGWDTFDSQFKDFLIRSDGVTRIFTLPYVPEPGTEINIYRNGVRIDDPNYTTKTVADQLLAVETQTLSILLEESLLLDQTLIQLQQSQLQTAEDLVEQQQILETLIFELAAIEPPGPANPVWANKEAEVIAQTTVVNDLEAELQALTIEIAQVEQVIVVKDSEVQTQQAVVDAAQAATDAIPAVINISAEMNSIYGDGESDAIVIPDNVTLVNGNIIEIRESTSDGSFRPDDRILDVEIFGGDLAYQSAKGIRPEDILIDGDGFVTPDTSHAPEEVVPGQLVDAVDIQVFHKVADGSPTIVTKHSIIGVDTRFDIGQVPNTVAAVIVKVDNIIQEVGEDYLLDIRNLQVVLNRPYLPTQEITIVSMSQNGKSILDLDSFIADGETTDFVTAARPTTGEFSLFVTVNGVPTGVTGFISDDTFVTPGNVVIRFSSAPAAGALIAFTVIDGLINTVSQVSKDEILHNGVSNSYELANPLFVANPLENNVIVVFQGKVLKSVDNFYFTVAGQSRTYAVSAVRYPFNSIGPNEIEVYVNGASTLQGKDWTWASSNNELKLKRGVANSGDTVVISVLKEAEYLISGSTITFVGQYTAGSRISITSFANHDILEIQRNNEVVSFNTELIPGTIEYKKYTELTSGRIALTTPSLSADYVWISLNGELLTANVDYILEPNLKFVRVGRRLQTDDVVEIIIFSSDTVRSAFGYRIFKDMLNNVKYQRFDDSTSTALAEPLKSTDPRITVVNGDALSSPNAQQNQPGVVYIDKERIEYLRKTGSVLSQLRRGTLGTGINDIYQVGVRVRDFSAVNTIPYKDETITVSQVSDGYSIGSSVYPNTPGVTVSSFSYNFNNNTAFPLGGQTTTVIGTGFRVDVKVLVGDTECATTYISETQLTFITPAKPLGSYDLIIINPARTTPFAIPQTSVVDSGAIKYVQMLLPFAPKPNPASESGWYKTTIPEEYWEGMDIEVFVGGTRLRKAPLAVFDQTLGPDSPVGDKILEAEFAVNKVLGQYVRLTEAPQPGVKVVVQKRVGRTWVNRNQSLVDSQSDPAKFVRARGVDLSE